MGETYYRFHWADCPDFTADNAWSAPWGSERSVDGSQILCPSCEGEGFDMAEYEECRQCGGTGWEDCEPGYSCTSSAEKLMEYFSAARGGAPTDADGQVIIFRGALVGGGCDGEPLVVPEEILGIMPWSRFAGAGISC